VKLPDPAVEVHGTSLFDVELRAVFEPPLAPTLLALEHRCKTATMRPAQPLAGTMEIFQWLLVLLVGAVALTAIARRVNVAYPSLLALGGVALALFHGAPKLELDPELMLALFVAPVLLDAAYDTSVRDLPRELDSDHVHGHRGGRHHDVRGRMEGARAGARHAVGGCDCTQGDRRRC
jgi:hypothetical protein